MDEQAMEAVISKQREFFLAGKTLEVEFRIQQVRKLREAVLRREQQLLDALKADLSKPAFEAYGSEIGMVLQEAGHAIKHLRSWARPRRVWSPIALLPSLSRIYPQPRGVVLIIGPWNYPIQLVLVPLIGAMAAGNCAVVKPSELAPRSSAAVAELIHDSFPQEEVAVIEGNRSTGEFLVNQPFDHIFFTGGTAVGRIVAQAAAKNLVPCTLELGGKSPCLVHGDVDPSLAARRVAWGKFYNAGQTCVAPDYVLVQAPVKDRFVDQLQQHLRRFFGDDPAASPDYARIINEAHFDRLTSLITRGKIVTGGQTDRKGKYIAPTVIENVGLEDPIMGEEIFGPILPILEYSTIEEAIDIMRKIPRPLSLYVFARDRKIQKDIVKRVPFGGGCLNDTLVHFTNPNLPFGGVGPSGIGLAHGKFSFDAFSHLKAIVTTPLAIDIPVRYPPYGRKLGLLRKLVK